MTQKRRWMRREWLNPEKRRPELGPEYGQFLAALPWDWYGTFTFAEWLHPERAAQIYEAWARDLAEDAGKIQTHARALEYQKRGVVHFHSLIWNVAAGQRRFRWMQTWETMGGGISRIFEYDRARGAAYYLPKYIVKNGEVDILRFGPPLGRPDDVRMLPPPPARPAQGARP
jgi:hypothetical protein